MNAAQHSTNAVRGSRTTEPWRSREHIRAIVDALHDRPRDRTLLILGVYIGLRASDLVHLRWGDVLTPQGSVRYKLTVVERKTQKERIIALGGKPRQALEEYHAQCGDVQPDAYLFPSRKGKGPLKTWQIHHLVNQWARMAGIKGHYGAHTLRRTYGWFHYDGNKDIALLMALFGHSHPSITLKYIGFSAAEQDRANANLRIL